jgi:hypothetical protein
MIANLICIIMIFSIFGIIVGILKMAEQEKNIKKANEESAS